MKLTAKLWSPLPAAVAAAVSIVLAAGCGGGGIDLSGKDTQCFAEFDSSARAEAAASEGRAAGFDVSHQPGNVAGAFIFETGKTGDDAVPLDKSFDRIVIEHQGHFGGSTHCVEHSAFD